MQNAKNWFFSQPFSSQILLTIAAAMLVIFLLVEYAFDPWKQHLGNLRQSVNNDIETVAWMVNQARQHQSKISQAKNKPNKQTDNTSSLITRIEQSAKQQKIYSSVERISPDKQGRVKVWINNGNFQQWIRWVEILKNQNIDVVDARVNQSATNAPISINVTFVAPQ